MICGGAVLTGGLPVAMVVTVAELFAALGSSDDALTLAWLLTVPACPEVSLTVTVAFCVPPVRSEPSVPSEQVTALVTVHDPVDAVAVAVVPAGTGSVNVTPAAAYGPPFETVNVSVNSWPVFAVESPLPVSVRSASIVWYAPGSQKPLSRVTPR